MNKERPHMGRWKKKILKGRKEERKILVESEISGADNCNFFDNCSKCDTSMKLHRIDI